MSVTDRTNPHLSTDSAQLRHDRIREIFHAVCDLSDDAREQEIKRLCNGDECLHEEVKALLYCDIQTSSGLDTPLADSTQDDLSERWPQRIGRYRILGVLGHGGMGIVYSAVQESPDRRVALKMIQGVHPAPTAIQRFEREATILGRLQHSGIAQIFEAGFHGGEPFFAMELVEGQPVTEFARARGLSTVERLKLFLQVCDAVQHAHQRGVIHRDLKPANLLVDQSGVPKVLDFGVARLLEDDESGATRFTMAGQIIGTLAYISPEQASGRAQSPDTRGDVYALGVILYQLLTDQLPLDLDSQSLTDALRIIADDSPKAPSTINRAARGDLDTIVMHAIEKDPGRRYGSAAALSEDIRRHLSHQPILARRPSSFYQLRKLARRHRTIAVGVVISAMALIAIASMSIWFGVQSSLTRKSAENLAYTAAIAAAAADVAAGDSVSAQHWLTEKIPESHQGGWEWRYLMRLSDESIRTVQCSEAVGIVAVAAEQSIFAAVSSRSSDSWLTLLDSDTGNSFLADFPLSGQVNGLRISSDGAFVIVSRHSDLRSFETVVDVWDVQEPANPILVDSQVVSKFSAQLTDLSRDRTLVIASESGAVSLWRLSESGLLEHLESFAAHANGVSAAAYASESGILVTAARDLTMRVWRIDEHGSHNLIQELFGHSGYITDLAISMDGRLLASGSTDTTVRLWQLPGSSQGSTHVSKMTEIGHDPMDVLQGHHAGVLSVSFSPDGHRLAVGTGEGSVYLWGIQLPSESWDAPTWRARWAITRSHETVLLKRYVGHVGRVESIEFLANGTIALSAASDQMIKWWPAASKSTDPVLAGHRSSVNAIAFNPNGDRLISGSSDTWTKAWDLTVAESVATQTDYSHRIAAVAWSPIGDDVAVLTLDGELTIRESNGSDVGEVIARLESQRIKSSSTWGQLSFDTTGTQLVSSGASECAVVWTKSDGIWKRHTAIRSYCGVIYDAQFGPDGKTLLLAEGDPEDANCKGLIRVFSASSFEELHSIQVDSAPIRIRASVDGSVIVASHLNGAISGWSAQALRPRWYVQLGSFQFKSIALHPFENRVAIGGSNGDIQILDSRTGDFIANLGLDGHVGRIEELRFSPDGSTLASVSGGMQGTDNVVRLWEVDVPTRTLIARTKAEALRPAVEELFAHFFMSNDAQIDVLRSIAENVTLTDDLKASLRRLVSSEATHPSRILDASWRIVIDPERTRNEYSLATSGLALALDRLHPEYLNRYCFKLSLALGQLRLKEFDATIATLESLGDEIESMAESRLALYFPDPAAESIRAMALIGLNRINEANEVMQRIQSLALSARELDPVAVSLMKEAITQIERSNDRE